MNQLTAHKEEYTRNRGDLYLAFELGSKEWKLGFSVGIIYGQIPGGRDSPRSGHVARGFAWCGIDNL